MNKQEAKEILKGYGCVPVTGLIDVIVGSPQQKEVLAFEELYERSTEGWGFGGHTGKLEEILVFEGKCDLIEKKSRRETREHSYRKSCLYIYDYITEVYQLSPDFCGIFVTETDRIYAGNVTNYKKAIFIKNPLSSAKIRFIRTEEGADGYIVNNDYKLLLNKKTGEICNQITVHKSLRKQSQKEADRVKTALSVLGIEKVKVEITFAYKDKKEKEEQLKKFEAEVKRRYKEALALLRAGEKFLVRYQGNEQVETLGNMEIYYQENTWENGGFGLSGTEEIRYFGFTVYEVNYNDNRHYDGNVYVKQVIEDEKFELAAEKRALLVHYYAKLRNEAKHLDAVQENF